VFCALKLPFFPPFGKTPALCSRVMADRIAIIGGTGQMGGALALRWARAGRAIIIGSRAPQRAAAAARAIAAAVPGADVAGLDSGAAARAAELVVLAVPYHAHRATLEEMRAAVQGKIVVDVTVPLELPRVARVALPPEGSAAVAAQRILGPDVRVVACFETVPAPLLAQAEAAIDGDVLVCGDDKDARETVVALARAAGLSALHGGALVNAAAAEALACVQIFLNGRYRARASGVRFTGLVREDGPA
jgi:8-hydroxy-5-deazaflavin:NADPH oxidoreductase